MNENGTELAGQDGDENAIESLADMANMLKADNTELVLIANHIKLIDEAMRLIMEQVTCMNQRLGGATELIKVIAEAEDAKEPRPATNVIDLRPDQPDQPDQPNQADQADQNEKPVHLVYHKDGIKQAFSLCGSEESRQMMALFTNDGDDVTCPECLAKIEAEEKS